MNINTSFNAPMGGGFFASGLSGRSMLGTNSSFRAAGANNVSTSPVFRESLVDIRSTADALRSAMRDVMGFGADPSTPFGIMGAISGNTEAMTINNGGRFANNARDFSVEILQLATAQRNEGAERTANARAVDSGFTVGSNRISLTLGDSTFDFNFNVSATDTNRDVQNRIASAINARGNVDVQASVVTSGTGANQTSQLVLQSGETGVNNASQPNFTVSGTAGALTALGVTNVTQQAQNAEFRVNRGGLTGALQTSSSNNVSLGSGVTATLRETGTVEVTMGRDELGQINAVRNMANLFNDLVEVARENNSGQNGGRLQRELRSLVNTNASSLARVGISINASGFMDIDEERMREAAASGDLENFMLPGGNRSNTGFFNRLERMADRVGRNAANFVGVQHDPMSTMAGPQNWSNHMNNQFNDWMNTGMLFDSMF